MRLLRMVKFPAPQEPVSRSPARSFTRLKSKPRSLARRLACPFDTGSQKNNKKIPHQN